MPSPFLITTPTASQNTLAILHLRRDLLTPTTLSLHDDLNLGYAEGKVTTTRFGSFPHSTLIGKPWGSQVKASKVDTGTRGRVGEGMGSRVRKRKRDEDVVVESEDAPPPPMADSQNANENDHGATAALKKSKADDLVEKIYKTAEPADTGFCHLLAPTPELWTASLPHRTQVVYTPDYSYILQRLRVLPGSIVIEAGAGSGSFTHAAARAVFSGYPDASSASTERKGKVYSFEFHLPRYEALVSEILAHELSDVVHLSHRDVCQDGFVLDDMAEPINASHIFLDLPAPWLALRHLTRKAPVQSGSSSSSPLNPATAIHIATFSPCIEQVTRTVSALRSLGWLEIQTVELQARHIEVRRERVGLAEEASNRGSVPVASTVSEAVTRLRDLEARERDFRATQLNPAQDQLTAPRKGDVSAAQGNSSSSNDDNNGSSGGKSVFDQGRLITRSEPELRTHTSYLTFAILPREWSAEDEEAARIKISALATEEEAREGGKMSKRQAKKAAKKAKLEAEAGEVGDRMSEGLAYIEL
ncbi:MAG: hypothetical protein Q9167_002710 [Letrouitia subvulpina]